MSMSANPQFMSKYYFEKQERAARNTARIVVCLLTALTVLSVATYRGYARHAAVCQRVNELNASKLHFLGKEAFASIKTAQEECQ